MPRKPPQPKTNEIPVAMKRALAERKPSADSEILLTELIDIWGGPRKLAQDLFDEFKKAPAGGATRQKILEMIQRLVITNTTQNLSHPITPSSMTKEELEKVAFTYMKRMTDGTPSPGSAGPG